MATIFNNPPQREETNNGTGYALALLLVLLIVFIFVVYGLPYISSLETGQASQQSQGGGPGIQIPGRIDVHIRQSDNQEQ